jgi:hypothetical protein
MKYCPGSSTLHTEVRRRTLLITENAKKSKTGIYLPINGDIVIILNSNLLLVPSSPCLSNYHHFAPFNANTISLFHRYIYKCKQLLALCQPNKSINLKKTIHIPKIKHPGQTGFSSQTHPHASIFGKAWDESQTAIESVNALWARY